VTLGPTRSSSTALPVSSPFSLLEAGAPRVLGRPLTNKELESFEKYLALLRRWQRVQRLIGSTAEGWVEANLFMDSLLFLYVLPRDARRVADLGSGAGFPGIPIKIVRPELQIALIESRERRVSFLSAVIRELGLLGTEVIPGRAESVAAELSGSYDAVVMRCAGSMEAVLPAALLLARSGGTVVMSGPPQEREISGVRWVEVPGVSPGSARRFAVVTT